MNGNVNWIRRVAIISLSMALTMGCAKGGNDDEPGTAPLEFAALRALNLSLYNVRYCEVLLATTETGGIRAEVYNTMTLNDCPQAAWGALDATAIASQFSVQNAILNGPRFWVLDLITANNATAVRGPLARFGEIEMYRVASVLLPSSSGAYQVNQVSRDTIFHYRSGRRVYELRDPDGKRYMMQSFSRIVDAGLGIEQLVDLGNRLILPAGWSFNTRILEANFDLPSVNGTAQVVTDDLQNTYQRIP